VLGPSLLAAGLVLLGIAGAALGWYPSRIGGPAFWLADNLYSGPVSALTNSPTWPFGAGALFVVALALCFGGCLVAIRWARSRREGTSRDLWRVLLIQLAFLAWLAIQPFVSSQDIFSYAFYARMVARYHVNPYVLVPRDLPFDPLFSAIFWKDQPSNYGPLWTYLSSLAPLVAGDATGLTLLTLKGIAIASALAGTPLLWDALKRHDPRRRVMGTVIYAWNPLLLVEAGVAGHNDIVMALFLIASVWLWLSGRRRLSLASLTLAALTKYVALILVPIFLVAWIRERRERWWAVVAQSAVIVLALTLAAFAPVYAGPQTLGVIAFGTNPLAYSNSAMELAFRQIRMAFGASSDLAELPLHYNGYWVGGAPPPNQWCEPDPANGTGVALPTGEPLLVVALPSNQWLHVFEPEVGRFGYVALNAVQPTAAPPLSTANDTTLAVLLGSAQDPAARWSNLFLRLASAALLLAALGWLLRTVRSTDRMLRVSLVVLLLYLMLVQTWYWPWYLIWAIPLAALFPESLPSIVALGLTVTSSLLNAQPNVSPGPTVEWLYESRMLAIDGAPLLVAVWVAWGRRGRPMPHWLGQLDGKARRVVHRLGQKATAMAPGFAVAAGVLAMGLGDLSVWRASVGAVDPPIIAWERAFGAAQSDLSAGNDAAAVQELNLVLDARPNELLAVKLRLVANLDMRHYADAVPDVTRLLAATPSDQSLRLERATLNQKLARGDRAIADYRQLIQMNPNNASAHAGAGEVAFDAGDLAMAGTELARATELAPSNALFARELAAVDAAGGKSAAARDEYDRAIGEDPSDAQTYAERAAFLRYAGYDDAPLPDLHHVLVLSGDVNEHQWAANLLASLATPADQHVEGTG
jgi:hypothetical protein